MCRRACVSSTTSAGTRDEAHPTTNHAQSPLCKMDDLLCRLLTELRYISTITVIVVSQHNSKPPNRSGRDCYLDSNILPRTCNSPS